MRSVTAVIGLRTEADGERGPRVEISWPRGVHRDVRQWVSEVAARTRPDRVVFADGSDAEWTRLTDDLVAAGTFSRLTAKPNSFYAASDPTDVARVEDRTFICSEQEKDAGATNNWRDPLAMKATMTELFDGSMVGRTMYVVPFCMGPYDARGAPSRYRDHRFRLRCRIHAHHDANGDARAGADQRRQHVGQGAALGRRAAAARRRRRSVAVQRHQVHRPFSRGADNLVVRLGVRRKRVAGQEVLLAAHRVRGRAGRGLAGRAHADPQADLSRGTRALRRRRLPVRLREDQSRDARADNSGLARPRRSATTSPG